MLQSLVQLRQWINILSIFYVLFLQVFFEFLVHFFGIELKDSRVAKDVLVVELVHLLDMKCPIRVAEGCVLARARPRAHIAALHS